MKIFQNLTVLFFCALLFCPNSSAFKIGIGSCPEPKKISRFSIEKFMGTWHEQRYLSSFPDIRFPGKCARTTLSQEFNDTIFIENSFILNFGFDYEWVVDGFAKYNGQEMGRIDVSLNVPVIGWRQSPLYVLSTDWSSEEYAIVWSCRAILGKILNFQSAYILSRKVIPDENFSSIIKESLKSLDLNAEWFRKSNQNQCEQND